MTMIRFLFYLFIFLYSPIAYAQMLTIKDKNTQKVLQLATVSAENFKGFVVSDAQGKADISSLKEATQIQIRLLGYQTLQTSYEALAEMDFVVYLTESDASLDQIVVSATRWRQSSNQVPAHISKVTREEVSLQNPQTTADLLELSGEVFVQKSQMGGGSPMIRGFSTNRLLIAVDGVRMNTAIFRSGNLQNVISLDAFALEDTEILFGTGSVMYGSDAIGGVMSFQTLNPELNGREDNKLNVNGQALLRYSSANNERTGHFDINLGTKKWAFLSSISSYQFGDLRMGSNGPEDYLRTFYVERQNDTDVVIPNPKPQVQNPTAYSQINLMQKIRFQPSKQWDLQYAFHYSATSEYARYDRLIRTRSNGQPRSAEWQYGPQIWMMNYLSIKHQKTTPFYDFMTLRLAHQLFEESRIDRNFNDPIRRTRLEKVNAFSANLDFNKNFDADRQLLYGLELVYNQVNSQGTDENITTQSQSIAAARYPDSNWGSYAAYLTYQQQLSPKVFWQIGARYNAFGLNSRFDTTLFPLPFENATLRKSALTGSVGLTYQPNQKYILKANLATGFRAPNIDDIGKIFDSTPGSVIVPNPTLQAEYAYNAEIGIAKRFGKSLKIDISAYYTYLDQALVRRDYTLNGEDSLVYSGELSQIQALQNAAKVEVHGIQLGLDYDLPIGLSLSTRLNYQRGQEELDNGEISPLRHAAPFFGVFRVRYVAKLLKLDIYALYNGEISYARLSQDGRDSPHLFAKDSDGNPYSPSWLTLNLKASYQLTPQWLINAGLENLTDRRYRPYSSGIAAAGRNFILSLQAKF